MKSNRILLVLLLVIFGVAFFLLLFSGRDDKFISFYADSRKQHLEMYWKDENGRSIGSLGNLKKHVESRGEKLVFAMNGGMYKLDHSPLGLFIQGGKTITPIDTMSGSGNFYMKPNGVFYIKKNKEAGICETGSFLELGDIEFATQSGPMLVIDGQLNPVLKRGSNNLNIRNAVGILNDGKLLFAMSKPGINFYDLADYFRKKGCRNALYLDGYVSRVYLPEENWEQTDGNFGVIIGVTEGGR